MTDNLFDIPESKSPRLIWMEKNKIKTHYAPHCEYEPWSAATLTDNHWKQRLTIQEAMAEECVLYEESGSIAYGPTELDAITDLAKKLNLKLWNEQ